MLAPEVELTPEELAVFTVGLLAGQVQAASPLSGFRWEVWERDQWCACLDRLDAVLLLQGDWIGYQRRGVSPEELAAHRAAGGR